MLNLSYSVPGNGRNVLKALVGNKCDKDREVPLHIAEQFAHNNNFDIFMETSALEAENVEKLFREIAKILVTRAQQANGGSISRSVTQNSFNQSTRSFSCPNCVPN